MTTDTANESPALDEAPHESTELHAEIEQLLEFKRERVRNDNLTPCPACTTLVKITVNQCPYCESNIAANNALVRESLRRLDEISAELDRQHGHHVEQQETPTKRSFGERLKHFFTGSAPKDTTTPTPRTPEHRLLEDVHAGDQFKVLESCGTWCKVKLRDGRTGWVYSTIVRDTSGTYAP
jgi:hypothetical protein